MSSSYYNSHPQGPSVMSPELQRAQIRLHQSEQVHQRTASQLQQVMTTRPKTPIEMSHKNEEIAQLRETLRQTEAHMNELRELVEKQKATIKHQSDQIAHPKQHYPTPSAIRYGQNDMPQLPPPPPPIFNQGALTNTPHNRPGPARPATQPIHQRQDSSPFGPPHSQQPARQHQVSQSQPTPFRQSRNVNEFGSPEALTQSFANMAVAKTPTGPSNRSNPTSGSWSRPPTRGSTPGAPRPPPAPTFNPANGMALIRTSGTGNAATITPAMEIVMKFAEVLTMAERYGYNHVNTPSTHGDESLSPDIKTMLLSAASHNTAFRFMQTPYTRYMLVFKIIVQFLLQRILRQDAFVGFDRQIDDNMKGYRSQIFGSTPGPIKRQLLTAIANEFKRVQSRPDFRDGLNRLAQQRADEMWPTLEKLMHLQTERPYEDLCDLMLKAYELAEMMACGIEEYRYVWANIGDRFRKDTMEPRDPYPNILPAEELERRGHTVKLGVTPLITSRTTSANGDVEEAQILKAFVLMETMRA
ncbi:hypothetical protein H2200_000555 [Cladophialophora chaetospira]|uniref:Uncharacterized protein n=1 Tax=Cladophialophora chaetospira TaxID=386627 RepID=A0AA38XNN3_9EURO|nr:hypothetical protein H2200_000555 [Cladophialophora chaetospira]